jgi:plastocyanin
MSFRHAAIVSAIVLATVGLGGGAASAGTGCYHGLPPSDAAGDTVEMTHNCFEATVLRIAPGTEVEWINRDAWAHTVTGVAGTWGFVDEDLGKGDTYSHRFDLEGVYVYSCLLHSGMAGAIVVGDGIRDAALPATVDTHAADRPGAGSIGILPWLVAGVGALALGLMLVVRSRAAHPPATTGGR